MMIHEYITRFLTKGCFIDVPGGHIQMMQEYAPSGSLEDLYLKNKHSKTRFSDTFLRYLVVQVLAALAYAHEQDVVHMDIKAANIFLTLTGDVKIGDWGAVRLIKQIKKGL